MKESVFKVFMICLTGVGFLLAFRSASFPEDKNVHFRFFSTSNVNGFVKPCG